MEEIWRSHPVYSEYDGSTFGRVRSWRGRGVGVRLTEPRLMRQRVSRWGTCGYMTVQVRHSVGMFVHRFIAECFIPNLEAKPQVNHINSNRQDNRVENLEWVTASENQKHAYSVGAQDKRGEKHHLSKLTERDVLQIRADYRIGVVTQAQIAEKYKVTHSAISGILSGRLWSHLGGTQTQDKRAWRCKMTMDQAREVRRKVAAGEATKAQLAREFDVSFGTITQIVEGKRYKEQ